jgi:hypothetical protein
MRYLPSSLVVLLVLGCATPRFTRLEAPIEPGCTNHFISQHFATNWYSAGIDVVGRHFSGLVLIKNIQEGEHRVVFTNEAGLTFFDFGFKGDEFMVYTVVRQFDKRAVIRTLRKDFELLLAIPFRDNQFIVYETTDERYFAVAEKNEMAYFITTKDCASLRRLERGDDSRATVSITFPGSTYPAPDSIVVSHHTFDLQVKLVRITKE